MAPTHPHLRPPRRAGLTLVELAVVLAIVAVLAGFLVPQVSRFAADARRTAALATLVRLRDAIAGTEQTPGFEADVGRPPGKLADLLANPFAPGDPLAAWDPARRMGWRGPYVVGVGGYDAAGDPAILDPWGSPVVLQFPAPGSYSDPADRDAFARLVSAGPDGVLQTPADAVFNGKPWPAPDARGDDLVVFLHRNDTAP
jgi:prepilin-type N-terminal cleavage/methylation domain-containing protein